MVSNGPRLMTPAEVKEQYENWQKSYHQRKLAQAEAEAETVYGTVQSIESMRESKAAYEKWLASCNELKAQKQSSVKTANTGIKKIPVMPGIYWSYQQPEKQRPRETEIKSKTDIASQAAYNQSILSILNNR